MEEFIENAKMLVSALGHKVFEEKRDTATKHRPETFYITAARGADGQGEPSSDGFVVFKGSKASAVVVNSLPLNLSKLRQKLIDSGLLVNRGDYLEFLDDCVFTSPSTAASILMGRNANGPAEWKLKSGQSLRQFETRK
jgi:hypothetical protein